MRKKFVLEEKPICNAVAVFRERGNYLQRIEQFEKAIQAYNEALRWNGSDVRSLLGRSLARVKATHYAGALADAAQAVELEPENVKALQIQAQTEYEKCAFERALVLASRGRQQTKFPPDFDECAQCSEETVRECTGKYASKMLLSAPKIFHDVDLRKASIDKNAPKVVQHRSRIPLPMVEDVVLEIPLPDKMRGKQISRLMAFKYLERMAHDKYFLTALCKDDRLTSANKHGSGKLLELAHKALADVEQRQAVLHERRPLYASRASEVAARARLSNTRKEQLTRTKLQYTKDAKRLVQVAKAFYEDRDTFKCLKHAEFAMEQILRKPASLLPGKVKFLQQLYDMVANAFLDQKRLQKDMSNSDQERRANILLGIKESWEPSHDPVLRVRPPIRLDARRRIRILEHAFAMSVRESERCYILHELARLLVDTKQVLRARFYASKCQSEARAANHIVWLLNALFLLVRCHLLHNNQPEAKAILLEAANIARCKDYKDVAEFYDLCVNLSLEIEVGITDTPLKKREQEMIDLMQDDDLRAEAQHLFTKMSVMPAARRFTIIPGAEVEAMVPPTPGNRRKSIIPKVEQPVKVTYKTHLPLGFQDFDI